MSFPTLTNSATSFNEFEPSVFEVRTLRSATRPSRFALIAIVALLALNICSNCLLAQTPSVDAEARVEVTGVVTDADTGQWLPARIYLKDSDGESWFLESYDPSGSSIAYREQWVPLAGSEDLHTTISAHPFRVMLPAGKYTLTVERGKEYLPLQKQFSVDDRRVDLQLSLQRWSHVAQDGWYSGETHVHRRIHELPNVMLAEDLNVAFPVTFWTIHAGQPPGLEPSTLRRQGPSPHGPRVDRGYDPIFVDETHVMFPRNTEYEIFQIGEKRHVLGAVFILNHRSHFQEGMPPVKAIAEQAHREGALLDLDKHSWPWSMMLVPVAKVDLYELANNSLWRTRFGFRNSMVRPAEYMKVESEGNLLTEAGWIDWGFQNYYALLNCGFPINPTAGTASGVHPVPLGFGRVYVHIDGKFNTDAWVAGLRNGRSFVTTGPMIQVKIDDRHAGHLFESDEPKTLSLNGSVRSAKPLDHIDVIVNGRVESLEVKSKPLPDGGHQVDLRHSIKVERTSWIAVRCSYEDEDQRIRFAHTAPWHVKVNGESIRPRRAEVQYLIDRMTEEIQRSRELLSPSALAEFQEALEAYQAIAKRAVD
jgi:hypothetical protein